jgi:mRNA degradation ribonuclease J1/J2
MLPTISQNLILEFIRVQHSIIETVAAALHTPNGAIVYLNDYKLDRTDEAIQTLEKVQSMKPGQSTTTDLLGKAYFTFC